MSQSIGGFGGFGAAPACEAADDVNLRTFSHARRAFALHFGQHFPHSKTSDQIKRTLSQQYEAKHDPLYAMAKYNDAANAAAALQKMVHYLQNFRTRKTEMCFFKCMVDAFLFEQNFDVPIDAYFTTGESIARFLELFESNFLRARRLKKEIVNMDVLYRKPHFHDIIIAHDEDEAAAQTDLLLHPLHALHHELSKGVPPFDVVENRLGPNVARSYRDVCDKIEAIDGQNAEVDLDEALQVGAGRRWTNTHSLELSVHAVEVYYQSLRCCSDMEAAEVCRSFFDRNVRQRQAQTARKRDEALAWGVWRIRSTQAHQWREAFFEHGENFDEYLMLEEKLRSVVTRGIYQYIPRRHYSVALRPLMFAGSEEGELGNLQKLREITSHIDLPPLV